MAPQPQTNLWGHSTLSRPGRRRRYGFGFCAWCGDRPITEDHGAETCSKQCGRLLLFARRRECADIHDGIVGAFSALRLITCACGAVVSVRGARHVCRPCGECARPLVAGRCTDRRCTVLRERRSVQISILDCPECGSVFLPRGVQAYCSKVCSRRALNRRKRHRDRELGRRAGRQPEVEVFTARQIAERDGWRCHLCGKRVPNRQYKARDDDPTLDHLVPLSDGGEHVRSNVALAHNRCNWERKTAGEVQLRLVG